MNERIQELAEQCYHRYSEHNIDLEKFAEMIVWECARALDDKLSNPNGASMAWCDGSDLLKHFGVKE